MIKANHREIFGHKIPQNLLNGNEKAGNKLDDFEILQKLGEGSFGKIIKVKSKLNSKIYAIKQLDFDKLDDFLKKKVQIELIILKKVDHPNVCKCIDYFEENGLSYIIMKYYNNKDLSHFLKAIYDINPPIKEEILWDIFHQCAEGLAYIHNQGIIHRDIKPQNILMDDNKEIQIGDFGIAAITNKNQVKNFTNNPEEQKIILLSPGEYAGTPRYMAPEIHSGHYDQRVDVFSLGVSFYELCYKTLPYSPNKIDMSELINDKNYSYELRNIIFKMIQKNPDERIDSISIRREIKKGYIKKYVKNSGIFSVIKCLFNFPNFEWFFTDDYILSRIIDEKIDKKVLYIMIRILQSLKDKKEVLENIYGLRKTLIEEGIKRKDNEEITPQEAINMILGLLNYDLNEKITKNLTDYIRDKSSKYEKEEQYLDVKENPGEEKTKLEEFKNNKLKIKSFISEYFQGILKIELECSKKHKNFLFRAYNILSFNCNLLVNSLNKMEFDIYEAFNCHCNYKTYFGFLINK